MIVIVGGPDDEESAAILTTLEQRSVEAKTIDARNLSTMSSVSVGLANAGLIDGSDVHAEDVTAVWLGSHGATLCTDAIDDLWGGLDVPILPALPCILDRSMDRKRQFLAAKEIGFPTESREKPCDEISVAVVGDRVFAVSHRSGTVYALPYAQRGRCQNLVDLHDLECAVLEFAVTGTNDLVFVRLDPLGDYASIEHASGLPVSRAIVDLLTVPNGFRDGIDKYGIVTERMRKATRRCHPSNGRLPASGRLKLVRR